MTDKEKKSKIADILMDFQEEYSNEVINRPMLASLYAGNILSFINSLQEEPVSVWHDASEEPEEGKDFAFVTYNGIMWARYRIEDIFLGWQKYRIQTEIDKWAYVSDLLKL